MTPSEAPETPPEQEASQQADPLQGFRQMRVHLLIHEQDLREQLSRIMQALKFHNVTVHPRSKGFLDSARQLGALLIQKPDGLFLVNPPLTVHDAQGRVRQEKGLPDYFATVRTLLAKARRDDPSVLSRCVPVFADIQFAHKREQTIISLAEYCVTGAFILKQQEPLMGLPAKVKAQRMKEQIMDRYAEVRDYLTDYLPQMDGALDALMERKEEQELSARKAEAEEWIQKAEECKAANDLDRAIQCLKKAIDLYPQDPLAYLESGRVYVRAKKYPNALKRFRQAEDIAESQPEPNKEIANVRIIQATERIENGESPTSPGVMELLGEAVDNYGMALNKADKVKSLTQDSGQDTSQDKRSEILASIAGEIFKHDLASMLGDDHPLVKELREKARDALVKVAAKSPRELPPHQLVFLGQAAMDQGNFEEAEKRYWEAAKDPAFFHKACDELCFLGTVARRRAGAHAALDIYDRLLARNPSNRGAVLFNMAVAHAVDNNAAQASARIVHALYVDPKLPEQEGFYKNHQLFAPLLSTLDLFDDILHAAGAAQPEEKVELAGSTQDRLEALILGKQDKEAAKLLWQSAARMPGMFTMDRFLASPVTMEYVEKKEQAMRKIERAEFQKFRGFLGKVLERSRDKGFDRELTAYAENRARCVGFLTNQGDQGKAAYHLALAAASCPNCVTEPAFFTNDTLVNLAREIRDKLAGVDRERLQAT